MYYKYFIDLVAIVCRWKRFRLICSNHTFVLQKMSIKHIEGSLDIVQ